MILIFEFDVAYYAVRTPLTGHVVYTVVGSWALSVVHV